MIPLSPFLKIGAVVWLVVLGVILARGGRPERLAALALLADLALVIVLALFIPLGGVRWHTFMLDTAVLLALGLIARRHVRAWLPWAIGLQSAAVLAHVPRMIDPTVRIWGYAATTNLLGYAVLAAVLAGAVFESRRNAR